MKYKEYTIFTNEDELDTLIEKLSCTGIDELVITDPRDALQFKQSGEANSSWNYVSDDVIKELEAGAKISFYTKEDEKLSSASIELLKENLFKISICDDNDWLFKWEEYFVPKKLGEKTVVKPIWKSYEGKEDEIIIDIDPGLAFGTGTSPTTFLAIRLIEKYLKNEEYIIDLGCGTGILSILAAKMGSSVLALDLDEKALESTKNNIKINNCDNMVEVRKSNLLMANDKKVNFIAANLTAELLIQVSLDIRNHLNANGILIASGIIDIKEEKTLNTLKETGFEILEILREDCWSAAALRFK